MTTKQIIDEALSLPTDQRALIADTLLRSLNTPDPEIDRQWRDTVLRRRDETRSGAVEGVAGEEVFRRIRERHGA